MNNMKIIKAAFERKVKLMKRKPDIGKGIVKTKIGLTKGLTCKIEEGNWNLIADMGKNSGGSETGPTPGTYGRAAFGSCLAITYMMYASKMNVAISFLEIEVEVDYDARGMYGFDNVFPGYHEVRYNVKVESSASDKALLAVLDKADQHSSYLAVFGKEQKVKRTIQIIKNKP